MRLFPLFVTLAKSQNFTCYVGDENELSIDSSCESEIGCFRNQVKTKGKTHGQTSHYSGHSNKGLWSVLHFALTKKNDILNIE